MFEAVKKLARAISLVLVLPSVLSFWLRAAVVGRDRALECSTQGLSLLPGITGQYLRNAFLRYTLGGCHPTATIEFGTIFSKAGARIDENAYIGPRCHVGLAHIGKDALIGAGVHIPSGPQTHGTSKISPPIREQPGQLMLVSIGEGAWIGSAAIVLSHVGRESVVGAGAVVSRPLPDRVVAAGVPARILRSREEYDINVGDSFGPEWQNKITEPQSKPDDHQPDEACESQAGS